MISTLLDGVQYVGNLVKELGNLGCNRKLLTCNYTIKVIWKTEVKQRKTEGGRKKKFCIVKALSMSKLLTLWTRERKDLSRIKNGFLTNGLHSGPFLSLLLFQGTYYITTPGNSKISVQFQRSMNIPILWMWKPSAHLLSFREYNKILSEYSEALHKRHKH